LPEPLETLLLQLPLNPSAPLESTGNVPLAGAALAAAASLPHESLVSQETADTLGDRSILDLIRSRSPGLVAFTLYMWNIERSIWIAEALKREVTGIITVAGGPEVTADNGLLLSSSAFDLLISGEGEELSRRVLVAAEACKMIGSGDRLIDAGRMSFLPGSYKDPWLEGYLDPSGGASIETVRGCPGRCTYCSYRRAHPCPRILDAGKSLKYIGKLVEAGAGEIVFLDPTFNSRPDLEILLIGMQQFGVSFFSEMRGDTISPETAKLIARAGFDSVEIGLQSINSNTLKRSGRPADPLKVLDGAFNLKREGVTPILDLMLGLPGDTPEDAIRAAHMIRDRGLHENLQVFYLSVLPGTVMRKELAGRYMPLPPYYLLTDKNIRGFAEARETISDIAGYDLDLPGRPLLFDDWPGTELVYLDENANPARSMPSFRHGAMRIKSPDFWRNRSLLLEFIRTRMEADPFCVLDVILCPESEFPLDILDMIADLDRPIDYSGRMASKLGRQGNLRFCVLLGQNHSIDPGWIISAADICTVIADVTAPYELDSVFRSAGVAVRLSGNEWDLPSLSSSLPADLQIFFENRSMEEEWSRIQGL
jgi:radical SAM superfamily enzyme YgiQ (UPF0313 family)